MGMWMDEEDQREEPREGLDDPQPPPAPDVWVTKLGHRIPLKDMSDKHLWHTLNMLLGKSPIGTRYDADPLVKRQWVVRIQNEIDRRL